MIFESGVMQGECLSFLYFALDINETESKICEILSTGLKLNLSVEINLIINLLT